MDATTGGSAGGHSSAGLARWFLLTGNRLLVALVILLGIGAAFFAVGCSGSPR